MGSVVRRIRRIDRVQVSKLTGANRTAPGRVPEPCLQAGQVSDLEVANPRGGHQRSESINNAVRDKVKRNKPDVLPGNQKFRSAMNFEKRASTAKCTIRQDRRIFPRRLSTRSPELRFPSRRKRELRNRSSSDYGKCGRKGFLAIRPNSKIRNRSNRRRKSFFPMPRPNLRSAEEGNRRSAPVIRFDGTSGLVSIETTRDVPYRIRTWKSYWNPMSSLWITQGQNRQFLSRSSHRIVLCRKDRRDEPERPLVSCATVQLRSSRPNSFLKFAYHDIPSRSFTSSK